MTNSEEKMLKAYVAKSEEKKKAYTFNKIIAMMIIMTRNKCSPLRHIDTFIKQI